MILMAQCLLVAFLICSLLTEFTALTDEDLKNLGVDSLGHRKKILRVVELDKKPALSSNLPPSPTTPDFSTAQDGTRVIADDPYLAPYAQVLRDRYSSFKWWKEEISRHEGSLSEFSLGYKKYGFHRVPGGILYQDWAPSAHALSLVGEFSTYHIIEKSP